MTKKLSAAENLRRQAEGAALWDKEETKRLQDLSQKISDLGGTMTMIHDEIIVDFHKDTPTDVQNEIFRLLQEHTMPKFEGLQVEVPLTVDAADRETFDEKLEKKTR